MYPHQHFTDDRDQGGSISEMEMTALINDYLASVSERFPAFFTEVATMLYETAAHGAYFYCCTNE